MEPRGAVEVEKTVKQDADYRRELSPEEYAVTRQKATEAPFTGRYWDHHRARRVPLRVLRHGAVPVR